VCENGEEVERKINGAIHVEGNDPGLIGSLQRLVAGMTFGGSSSQAELGNQAISALGSAISHYKAVVVFPTTYEGNPVLTAAATGWPQSGDEPFLALRSDVASMVRTSDVNRYIRVPGGGFSTVRGCHAIGHEGVHMALGAGSGEGVPSSLQGGFRCK